MELTKEELKNMLKEIRDEREAEFDKKANIAVLLVMLIIWTSWIAWFFLGYFWHMLN